MRAVVLHVLLVATFARPVFAAGDEPWLQVHHGARVVPEATAALESLDEARRDRIREDGYGYAQVFVRRKIHIDTRGDVTIRSILVRLYTSDAGVQNDGNAEFPVDTSREDVTIATAYSISPAGEVHYTEPGTIQTADDSDPSLFSDWKRVVVPFRKLEVGSAAVLETERRIRAGKWPMPWDEIYYLQSLVPIERQEFFVRWDQGSRDIAWASNDDGLECTTIDRRSFQCVRGPTDALDVDAAVQSYFDLVPQLFVGTPLEWSEFSRQFGEVLALHRHGSDAVRRKAAELVADAAGVRDKVVRLHRFVADGIRYVGLERGLGAIVPRLPDVTLERRFGDCKDMAMLFVALAEAAGVDAYPVITGALHYDLDHLVRPSLQYFNHMIVCADVGEEQPICVDPTVPLAPMTLPPLLHGAAAVAIRPGGLGAEPFNLPTDEFVLDVALEEHVNLGCDGKLKMKQVRRFSGAGSVFLRATLSGLRSEDRLRWAETEVQSVYGDKEEPSITIGGLNDPGAPIEITSEMPFDMKREMEIFEEFTWFDPWLPYYARNSYAKNKHHALPNVGVRYVATHTFTPCEGYETKFTGARLIFDSRFGHLHREYERTPGGLQVETKLEVPRRTVPIAELDSFRKFLDNGISSGSIWFGIKRK